MGFKLGVLGYGNMGGAIIQGAVKKGVVAREDILIYDPKDAAVAKAEADGIKVLESSAAVAKAADIILLAVKPQQFADTAVELGDTLDGKAVFSIVAGKTISSYREVFKGDFRLLRILPNTPALVFEGMFALCKEHDLKDDEKAFADKLFSSIGIVEWVKEYDIDAVCGLSGGGPAYVAMFIEALSDGGVKQGLTRDAATKFAAQTVLGTAKMVLDLGIHPGQLKDMVTSPAGTTIEGVEMLEANGFRYGVMSAVIEATERSRELQ